MVLTAEGGYQESQVYKLAHQLGVAVHKTTEALGKLDMLEQGIQLRRTSKRVSTAIVEAFSMKPYREEMIQTLYRGYAAAGVTIETLDYLRQTEALAAGTVYEKLRKGYQEVRRGILREIQKVEQQRARQVEMLRDEETSDNIDITSDF